MPARTWTGRPSVRTARTPAAITIVASAARPSLRNEAWLSSPGRIKTPAIDIKPSVTTTEIAAPIAPFPDLAWK